MSDGPDLEVDVGVSQQPVQVVQYLGLVVAVDEVKVVENVCAEVVWGMRDFLLQHSLVVLKARIDEPHLCVIGLADLLTGR